MTALPWVVLDRDNHLIARFAERIEAEVFLDGKPGHALDWKDDQ